MPTQSDPKPDPNQRMAYQIRIQGHLGLGWSDWFGEATIARDESGETLLTCREMDQAALHGLLRRLRDLGIPLLEITRIPPEETASSDGEAKTDHRKKRRQDDDYLK